MIVDWAIKNDLLVLTLDAETEGDKIALGYIRDFEGVRVKEESHYSPHRKVEWASIQVKPVQQKPDVGDDPLA